MLIWRGNSRFKVPLRQITEARIERLEGEFGVSVWITGYPEVIPKNAVLSG